MIDIPGKIPIRIHPYFWLISVLIGWLSTENVLLTLLWAGVIFLSILFHEFGHALTAMLFGQKATIDLVAMGGLTQRSGPPLKLWQEFILVLNGPLAGFLLYFISSSLKKHMSLQGYPLISYSLVVAIYINWYWTLINLIPIQPMDGGRLFSLFMEYFFGFKGVKIALFTSMILAAILGALCFYLNFLFAGVLLFMFMFDTYRHWKESLRISDRDHQPDLQLLYQQGKAGIRKWATEGGFSKIQTNSRNCWKWPFIFRLYANDG
jgi:Zn-dependent protease